MCLLFNCLLLFTFRCYADATLEISQVVKEDAKEKALSAATSELEKLFKKEDFGRMKVIKNEYLYNKSSLIVFNRVIFLFICRLLGSLILDLSLASWTKTFL